MKKFAVILIFCLAIASVTAQEQKGDLWVLAVGINDYSANSQIFPNLQFCVNDAQNICEVFKVQEGKAFNNVHTLLIADTETVKPTRSNILSNLSFLRNAGPNDTVIVYFALHSMTQDGVYYLLPSDFMHETGERFVPASMINFNDILNSFGGQGAKIIMLDTHYSETAIRLASSRDVAILGACRDDEQARESSIYGGFFTYSIVNAFNGGAGLDGKITLGSLFAYVFDRVRGISRDRQNPVLYIPPRMGNPVLGLVDK